jgi:hypothetical protein
MALLKENRKFPRPHSGPVSLSSRLTGHTLILPGTRLSIKSFLSSGARLINSSRKPASQPFNEEIITIRAAISDDQAKIQPSERSRPMVCDPAQKQLLK